MITASTKTGTLQNEGVRLASMHAMKGLEFRCVAVAGANDRTVPFVKEVTAVDIDRLQHDSDLLRERCLLFVACTRAREALSLSWTGSPSPFLPPTTSAAPRRNDLKQATQPGMDTAVHEDSRDCPGSGQRGTLEFQKGGDDWY